MNDDLKILFKYVLAIFLPVIFIILIYVKLNQPYNNSEELVKSEKVEILKDDDNFIDSLDALTLSLALPNGVLKRSFPERWAYIGELLQKYNNGDINTPLKFSRECLKTLLNAIDYWDNEEFIGTYEAYKEEYNMIRTINEDDIKKIPNDSFINGYERFLLREMADSNSTIKERLFYDNSIIYICENKYTKYIISYDLYDDVIENYMVVSG